MDGRELYKKETRMAQLEIPESLGKWVVAYRTISDLEYIFYLRELNIDSISIKAEELKESKNYCGEIRFKIDNSISISLTVPESASANSAKTVVRSLKEFLAFRLRQESRSNGSNQQKSFINS
jgi:hypothetical protein